MCLALACNKENEMKNILFVVAVSVLLASVASAQTSKSSETVLFSVDPAKTAVSVSAGKTETVGTFDKLWVRNVTITGGGTRLQCTVGAFDGMRTVAEYDRRITVAADKDKTLAPVVASLTAAVKAAAGQEAEPAVITVNAPHAKAPTNFVAVFQTADPQKPDVYQIRDLYGDTKAAPIMAEYDKVLAWLAAQQSKQGIPR